MAREMRCTPFKKRAHAFFSVARFKATHLRLDFIAQHRFKVLVRANVNSLLRRSEWTRRAVDQYVFAGRTIDFETQELKVGDHTWPLTLMEVNLLRYLIQHAGKAVSRKAMLEDVWAVHEDTDTRAIDNFIVRLRRYIEKDPSKPKHLLTVRGVGYRFVDAPENAPPE